MVELPGPFLKELHGDARIVLQDVAAAAQDGAADLVEVRFVHEVGGRLHVGGEGTKVAHKFEGSFFGIQLPVAEVGGEVVNGFGLAVGAAEFHFDTGNGLRFGGLGGVGGGILEGAGGIEHYRADGGDLVAGADGEEHH